MRFFCFFLFCIQFCGASLLFSAILPHQGRVLVSGEAFDGNASFRFALVDPSTGNIVWNHTGTSGVPEADLVLEVKNGFYKCPLGDTTVTGMAELSSQFFTYYNDLKLRVWFNDGVNGFEQIIPDLPDGEGELSSSMAQPPCKGHRGDVATKEGAQAVKDWSAW